MFSGLVQSGYVARACLCAAHKKHAESLINRMEHEYSCLATQHVTPQAINQIHVFFFSLATEKNHHEFELLNSFFLIMIIVIFNIHTREIKLLKTDLPQLLN